MEPFISYIIDWYIIVYALFWLILDVLDIYLEGTWNEAHFVLQQNIHVFNRISYNVYRKTIIPKRGIVWFDSVFFWCCLL